MKANLIISLFSACLAAPSKLCVHLLSGNEVYSQQMTAAEPIDLHPAQHAAITHYILQERDKGVQIDPEIQIVKIVAPDRTVLDGTYIPQFIDGEMQDVRLTAVVYEDIVKKMLKILTVSPGKHSKRFFDIDIEPESYTGTKLSFQLDRFDRKGTDRTRLFKKDWQMSNDLCGFWIEKLVGLKAKDRLNAILFFGSKKILSDLLQESKDICEENLAEVMKIIQDSQLDESIEPGNLSIKVPHILAIEIQKPDHLQELTKENLYENLDKLRQTQICLRTRYDAAESLNNFTILNIVERHTWEQPRTKAQILGILRNVITMAEEINDDYLSDDDPVRFA